MTNEVLETIKKRRSVRAYKPDAVPQELLDAVLEAGTYAPTGRGQQSPVIIAVSAAEYRKKIAELNAAVMGKDGDPYYGAPTVILVLTDKDSATGVEDASCVLENMMLAAASLGLGALQCLGDQRLLAHVADALVVEHRGHVGIAVQRRGRGRRGPA